LAPDSCAHHVFFAVTIQQTLNQEIWDLTWKHLIARHPILRTIYHTKDGRTIQTVYEDVEIPLQWEQCVECDQLTLEQKMQLEITQPFALDKELPLRLRMYSKNHDESIFLFVAHHISCDLHSIMILMRECGLIYKERMSNRTVSLPNIVMTYQDYAYHQIGTFESDKEKQHEHYWRKKLSGPLPTLNLMTDTCRQPVQTFNGATIFFNLSNDVLHPLLALAKSNSVTLYTLLVAMFQVLLYRYTGQDDIIIGSPVSGRDQLEVQSVVGCFINTIALRSKLAVDTMLKDTTALKDEKTGAIEKNFITDLNLMINKIK